LIHRGFVSFGLRASEFVSHHPLSRLDAQICSVLVALSVAVLPGNEDPSALPIDDFRLSGWKKFRNRNPTIPVSERPDGTLPDRAGLGRFGARARYPARFAGFSL
jgi:hypothetical protein